MTSQTSVQSLLAGAQDDGLISAVSAQVLGAIDLGDQIQAGLGINCDDVMASEAVLVTILVDDSSSIRFGNNTQLVRDGHNLVLDSLTATKQSDDILMHTRYLNGTVLYPYSFVSQVPRMDSANFSPSGGTPLFPESVVTLGTVIAKTKEFADNGVPVRGITLIVTDGGDTSGQTPADVKKLVKDLLATETQIVAGMGIDDGYTDFRAVFSDMGIPDEWILTPGNTETEIRAAFTLFSQSAVQVSQGSMAFSQVSLGGFGS